MERSYPSYVNCAAPGDSRTYLSLGNVAINAFGSLFFGGLVGGAFALIALAITGALELGCAIGSGVFVFFITALWTFKAWYGNLRLMCIDSGREPDRCVVGTMADEPSVGFDGDRKIDMILAPFIFRDEVSLDPSSLATVNCKDYFIAEIRAHPELFGPGPVDDTDTSQLISYIDSLTDEELRLLYMRVVHERMYHGSVPGRHFHRPFHVRDQAEMGADAFNESPDDTFGTSDPDPMFRFDYRPPIAPFMHCELEGRRWQIVLDNIAVGLWTAFAAFVAACIVCTALGLPEPACTLIGAGIALLLGFLAWLFSNWVNDPEEGDAEQTDVDFEDPAYDGDRVTILPGDSLLIYGRWIMDEEHGKFFELHPIKAIYLICNASGGGDHPWELVDDLSGDYPRRERCPYPMERVTAEDKDAMCGLVTDAEVTGPILLREVPSAAALSMLGGLR